MCTGCCPREVSCSCVQRVVIIGPSLVISCSWMSFGGGDCSLSGKVLGFLLSDSSLVCTGSISVVVVCLCAQGVVLPGSVVGPARSLLVLGGSLFSVLSGVVLSIVVLSGSVALCTGGWVSGLCTLFVGVLSSGVIVVGLCLYLMSVDLKLGLPGGVCVVELDAVSFLFLCCGCCSCFSCAPVRGGTVDL